MREEGKVGRGTTFMNGAGEINEMAEGKNKRKSYHETVYTEHQVSAKREVKMKCR